MQMQQVLQKGLIADCNQTQTRHRSEVRRWAKPRLWRSPAGNLNETAIVSRIQWRCKNEKFTIWSHKRAAEPARICFLAGVSLSLVSRRTCKVAWNGFHLHNYWINAAIVNSAWSVCTRIKKDTVLQPDHPGHRQHRRHFHLQLERFPTVASF